MTNRTRWLAVAVAGGALAAAGCQNENRSDVPPSSTVGQTTPATGARMDDSMKTNIVLRQLHAANQDEIKPTVEAHRDHAKNLMRGLTFSATAIGGGPSVEGTPEGMQRGMMGKGDGGGMMHQQGTRQEGTRQEGTRT